MDVRLPSGQVIRGVPDGTTRAQLAEKLSRNGFHVPDEWMTPASSGRLGPWASAVVRPLAKGVAALPMMAMDAGVAARNLTGDATNKVLGRPATPDYELPSAMFNTALNSVTTAPSTTSGRIAEGVSSALVGGKLGPEVPVTRPTLAPAVSAARDSGYVLPPSQVRPSMLGHLAEGFAGKVKTAQSASLKNQEVTNRLARESLGLSADTPITTDALNSVRKKAGQAYARISNIGAIKTDHEFADDIDIIGEKYASSSEAFGRSKENPVTELVNRLGKVKSFSGKDAVNEIQLLREEADKAAASRDKGLATALRNASAALEDQIERHLDKTDADPELIRGFRDARKLIAKTYSVQSALDRGTGDVSAQKLAGQLARDRPLTGGLRKAAETATAFPKSTQLPSKVGSVTHFSPLDTAVMGIEGASGLSAAIASGNPKAAAAAAAAMAAQAARPAVRAGILSKAGQNLAAEGTPVAKAAAKRLTLSQLQQLEREENDDQ